MDRTTVTSEGMGRLFLDMDALAASRPARRLAAMSTFLDLLPVAARARPAAQTVQGHPGSRPGAGEMAAFLDRVGELSGRVLPPVEPLDVWRVAGLARNELRNASVLAWALDPRGSHGFGPAVLDGLAAALRAAWDGPNGAGDVPFPFPADNAAARVRLEANPLADPHNRVDITVEGPESVVHVELKVDARERSTGGGQVASYLELARMKAAATGRSRHGVLFVAPKIPARLSADGPRVLVATWAGIAAAIRGATAGRSPTLPSLLLAQFADHVSKL